MLDRSPSKVNIRILEQILLNMSGDLEEYYVAPEQIKVYYIFHKTNIFNGIGQKVNGQQVRLLLCSPPG